jgi:phosphotriesterase-related protein
MSIVMTVLGPVESADIGITLPHEHLLIDARDTWFTSCAYTSSLAGFDQEQPLTAENRWAVSRDPRALRDNLVMGDRALAARELEFFREVGGSCVVDVSSIGLRQPTHAQDLKWISQETGVHIVAGSGFYLPDSYPSYVETASARELAEKVIADLTDGIDGSGVTAGVIGEIGTTELDATQEKVLRASALAYKATGAPISVHTSFECMEALRIAEILTSEGVPSDAVIMGHMDENLVRFRPEPVLEMLDYHIRVAETGVWIEYDTFGSEFYWDIDGGQEPRDTDRVAGVVRLIEAGFENQLLLSHDIWIKQCLRRYGGWGFDHIVRSVVPMLMRAGLSKGQVDRLLLENPVRAISIRDV